MTVDAEQLQADYFADQPDIVVRHYPDSSVEWFRWQLGRNVTELVDLPGEAGESPKQLEVERFELLAWAHSADALIEKMTNGHNGNGTHSNGA